MKRICLLLLACLPLLCAPVFAQPAPPSQNNTPPSQHDGMDRHNRGFEHGMDRGHEHGGLMGLPPGTWWKSPDVISRLTLTADQQAKMDEIFRQNRLQLVDFKASLEKEQINLEPLLNANPVDTNKALAEISKIADLRASLEKANAKMLLGLRSVLTADQWTKLHTRPERGSGPAGPPAGQGGRGPRGGPGGPSQGGAAPELF